MARSTVCQPYNWEEDLNNGRNVQPFVFISYAHSDKTKVFPIINNLHRLGVRIWFDDEGPGIPSGADWHSFIFKTLEKSSCCLSFVSQHNQHRSVVCEEMEEAIKKSNADSKYSAVFVLLEKIAVDLFPSDDIKSNFRNNQFVGYSNGLTEKLIRSIVDSLPDDVFVGNRPPINGANNNDCSRYLLSAGDSEYFALINGFEREEASFNIDGYYGPYPMYRTSASQLSHTAVFVTCLDNQWVPQELLTSEKFHKGFDDKIRKKITECQKTYLLRALFSNYQVVINRAAVVNGTWFKPWHTEPGFGELVDDGAILFWLYAEDNLLGKLDFETKDPEKTGLADFCRSHAVTCVRLDWDKETNRAMCQAQIGQSFHDFWAVLPSSRQRLDDICAALNIKWDERELFYTKSKEIRDDVKNFEDRVENHKKTYCRQRFYENFVVKNKKVVKGIIDWRGKRFAKELKTLADFRYVAAAPEAMDIRMDLPPDAPLQAWSIPNFKKNNFLKKMHKDELTYLLCDFDPSGTFGEESVESSNVGLFNIGFKELNKYRKEETWQEYLSKVTECIRRSKEGFPCLYDALMVWEARENFLDRIPGNNDGVDANQEDSAEPAISVLLHFQSFDMTIVYKSKSSREVFFDEEERKESFLNNKTLLNIGFVCCDVINNKQWEKDISLYEIQLFEGATAESANEVIDHLLEYV